MATMIAEVYDAFKAAGVDDEKARKAAEAVASYENKFQDLKTSLLEMKANFNIIEMDGRHQHRADPRYPRQAAEVAGRR